MSQCQWIFQKRPAIKSESRLITAWNWEQEWEWTAYWHKRTLGAGNVSETGLGVRDTAQCTALAYPAQGPGLSLLNLRCSSLPPNWIVVIVIGHVCFLDCKRLYLWILKYIRFIRFNISLRDSEPLCSVGSGSTQHPLISSSGRTAEDVSSTQKASVCGGDS